ncbi:MAG TPA: hypothetical protein VNW04_15420 [Puia sp.]|nr:hypothetical protein [Puia sp.]
MKYLIAFLAVVVFSCSGHEVKKPAVDSAGGVGSGVAGGGSAPAGGSATGRDGGAGRKDPMTVDMALPFAGIWVDTGYMRRISTTRSPTESQKMKETCYLFPARTLQDVKTIWNFHEGGMQAMVIRDGDSFRLVQHGMTDSIPAIELLANGQLRVGAGRFVKVAHGDSTVYDWGIIEATLFEGHWRDSTGGTVVFSANGTVVFPANGTVGVPASGTGVFAAKGRISGLDTLRTYMVSPDYEGDPQPVDLMILKGAAGGERRLGFRFAGDSLGLYEIKCEDKEKGDYCSFEALGTRVASLVRMK